MSNINLKFDLNGACHYAWILDERSKKTGELYNRPDRPAFRIKNSITNEYTLVFWDLRYTVPKSCPVEFLNDNYNMTLVINLFNKLNLITDERLEWVFDKHVQINQDANNIEFSMITDDFKIIENSFIDKEVSINKTNNINNSDLIKEKKLLLDMQLDLIKAKEEAINIQKEIIALITSNNKTTNENIETKEIEMLDIDNYYSEKDTLDVVKKKKGKRRGRTLKKQVCDDEILLDEF